MDKRIFAEEKKFIKYLDENSIRLTSGRKIVFEEAMKAHGHFAPEELLKQCQINKRKVSRATVYRSLRELLEAGVIRETAYGDKHTHYEHIYDEKPHHHARCIRCGGLTEIPDLKEEVKYESILNQSNFKVLGHEMVFYGICENCQSK